MSPEGVQLSIGEYDLNSVYEPQAHIYKKVHFIATHPDFNSTTFDNDLALLWFREPVKFAPNVIPICISEEENDIVNETGWVTGWGQLYKDGPISSVLQEVALPIISNQKCEDMFYNAGYNSTLPNILICAGYDKGGKDTCKGDSGGPLVVQMKNGRFNLAGISSWGIGCAEENQPGVYTRISKFYDWIHNIINSERY